MARAIQVHQNLLQQPKLSRLEHAYVLLCLGLDFKRGGFVDRALEAFNEVLTLDPNNQYALLNLQKLHEEQHQWAEARAVRQKLVALSGPDTQPRNQAILAFLENALGTDAIETVRQRARRQALRNRDRSGPEHHPGVPESWRCPAGAGRSRRRRSRLGSDDCQIARTRLSRLRSPGAFVRGARNSPAIRRTLPASDCLQSTRLARPPRAGASPRPARQADRGLRVSARGARAEPARPHRPSGDLECAADAGSQSRPDAALHRSRHGCRCSSSIRTSASSATTAAPSCCGAARTATNGIRSSKSASLRPKKPAPRCDASLQLVGTSQCELRTAGESAAQRLDHLGNRRIRLLVSAVGANHVVGPGHLLFDGPLRAETALGILSRRAVACHDAGNLQFWRAGGDDDRVECSSSGRSRTEAGCRQQRIRLRGGSGVEELFDAAPHDRMNDRLEIASRRFVCETRSPPRSGGPFRRPRSERGRRSAGAPARERRCRGRRLPGRADPHPPRPRRRRASCRRCSFCRWRSRPSGRRGAPCDLRSSFFVRRRSSLRRARLRRSQRIAQDHRDRERPDAARDRCERTGDVVHIGVHVANRDASLLAKGPPPRTVGTEQPLRPLPRRPPC